MSRSSELHRETAAREGPVPIAVVTVSDTRTAGDDANGRYLRERIQAAGHEVAGYLIVPDEPGAVVTALEEYADRARIILFNGGTGISRRDSTFEALSGRLEKVLPGFGEIFRMLGFQEIGASAMLSRAIAGTYGETIVFSTPGSPAAVRLAWEQLIEPEVGHIAWELMR